jgi:hypothetical protein
MKKIFLGFLLLLFSITLNAQNSNGKRIYENYGTWSVDGENNNKVSISAFVTVEEIIKKIDPYELKLEMQTKNKREIKEIEEFETIFRYELYLKSNSIYKGDTTNTWIYGARVFINGKEFTKEKFPDGFMISIEQKPTLIYWYETTSKEKIDFHVEWESAVYENRLDN